MATFIIRRIIWTIPVILLVIFMTFVMMKQIGMASETIMVDGGEATPS